MTSNYRRNKRLLDLLLTVPVAIVLAPFATVTCVIIRRTDNGPALYRAERIGQGGERFTMYKFRTMVADAESRGGSSTSARDPRITPIGHWLRRWKLDEIPQLINVIRGEMSLVGPRPTLDWDVARYTPDERRLLSVKPGITDWASIRFRDEGEILKDEADPDEAYDRLIRPAKIRLGLAYVDGASLKTDLSILWNTSGVLLGREPRRIGPNLEPASATPKFARITEDWSTRANEQQWELAGWRYSAAAALGRGKVLAEVGCGTGYGLSRVAEFTQSSVGLDIDERNLAIARQRAPQCEFILGDAESLPFLDGDLDCLVALEMIYYLEDQRAFVAEAARTLDTGGKLLLSLPNPRRKAFQPSPFSTHYPDIVELSELLVAFGFDVEVYGAVPLREAPMGVELLRHTLVRLHLVPSTIEGRAKLKSLLFRHMRRLDSIEVDPDRGFADFVHLSDVQQAAEFAVLVVVGCLVSK